MNDWELQAEIRRGIAEWVGYHDFKMGAEMYVAVKPGKVSGLRLTIPRYTEDLNIMREVETLLADQGYTDAYLRELRATLADVQGVEPGNVSQIDMVTASATRRAEAAYIVVVGAKLPRLRFTK